MSSAPPDHETTAGPLPKRWRGGVRLGPWGWTALGAVGLVGAVWLARAPLAQWAIGQTLGARGVEHEFTLDRVELDGVTIRGLRIGPANAPDVTAAAATVRIVWAPLPRLDGISAHSVRARARLTDTGLSFGALDRFADPAAPAAPFAIPALAVDLKDLRLDVDTPFGAITAIGAGQGRLREDFTATATLSGPQGLAGQFKAQSTAQAASLTGQVNAQRLALDALTAAGLDAAIDVRLSADGATGQFSANGALASASIPGGFSADGLKATANGALNAGALTDAGLAWTLASNAVNAPGLLAANASARGQARVSPAGMTSPVTLDIPSAQLTPQGRAAIAALTPTLPDTPFGPTFAALRTRLLGAGAAMTIKADGAAAITADGAKATLSSARIASAAGAVATLSPEAGGLAFAAPDFWPAGTAALTISGGGLPSVSGAITAGADGLKGRITMAPFKAGDATLAASLDTITATRDGAYAVDGALVASGPLAGGRIEAMTLPLALQGRFGEGFSMRPQDGCLPLTAARMVAAGGRFANPALALCADGQDFLRVAPNGAMSGGVRIAGRTFQGALTDTGKPASLHFDDASIRFAGRGGQARVNGLRFTADLEAGRLAAHAANATATFDPAGVRGAIEGGGVDGPALPVTIADARVSFRTQGEAIALSDGQAIVRDAAPQDAPPDWRPRFNALRIEGVNGLLDEGVLRTSGDVVLDARGQRLGAFRAEHALLSNRGAAKVAAENLVFDRSLDAYDISDPIRGVASNVNGALDSELNVAWDAGALSADGWLRLSEISFNTAALGPVEGVSGEIRFDDLLNLKSLPHQRFTIGRLDPGIGVADGDVRFQILGPTQVQLESARWPFAGGALTVDPQTLDLSSRRFAVTLGLTEIDLSSLIDTLGLADLQATGRVTGRFPLQFDEEGGAIVNGVLESLPGGGDIAYTGPIADTVQGPSRLAFDALQSFRYDDLKVTLNGRLEGDISGSIAFKGVNTAPIRDLTALSPLPGVTVPDQTGLPFEFDVAVSAPFRQLLRSYQGVVDARTFARQALDQQPDAPLPPVDREGQPPR